MLVAARGLVRDQWLDVPEDPDTVVAEFKSRLVDPQLFWDKYAGGKFAHYLLSRHREGAQRRFDRDHARYLLEETQLFIEAAHACNAQLEEQRKARSDMPVVKRKRRRTARQAQD